MPFTPFHMGPGLLVKGLMRGSFSLLIFGWAQFLMDIQPLYVILTGEGNLHGFSHTYIGATLIAIFAAVTGKHPLESILRYKKLNEFFPISWKVAMLSAFIGTYSHVVLDSIMHSDMHPVAPFSQANTLLHMLNHSELHWFCIITGAAGTLLCLPYLKTLVNKA